MLMCVLVLGVLSSAVAYCCWAKAMAKTKKTSSVSNYMCITHFLTSLLGFLITKEKVDISTVIGGIIIIVGLAVFSFHSVDIKAKK